MDAIMLPSQECCGFQTRWQYSNSKIARIKEIIEFETYCSILMDKCFNYVKEKKWDSEQAASEIITQVVHMLKSMIQAGNKFLTEDELTDILSNILLLAHYEGISFTDISEYADNESHNIIELLFLSSELLDEIRKRKGYKVKNNDICSTSEIIKDRLSRMLLRVYNYSEENGIDLIVSCQKMHQDNAMYLQKKLEEQKDEHTRIYRHI